MEGVISEAQRRLNRTLHEQNDHFGNRADGAGLAGRLPQALLRMHELGICNSVLDYGTGKGKLVQRLRKEIGAKVDVEGYDPAVPAWAEKPKQQVDILICLDVLEHIEMESIDAVLMEIKHLTRRFCYLVVDLQPAIKQLSDGRNAHILLAPPDWWVNKLSQLFPCIAAFPIYHEAGPAQKIVIACTHDTNLVPLMYSFLMKLKLFQLTMRSGVLAEMARQKACASS